MGNERSCVISVLLCTGVYRHIRISERATLFQLHQAIIGAFGFDDDHAHAFFVDNIPYSSGDAYTSIDTGQPAGRTKN